MFVFQKNQQSAIQLQNRGSIDTSQKDSLKEISMFFDNFFIK